MKTREMHDVYVIAEIGGNHEGDFGLAKELLNQAVEAGVDAIKFQAYTGDGIANKVVDPDRVKHFNKFTLSLENHIELAEMCLNSNVDYLASVWNENMLHSLIPYMKYVKVGSGDLTNYRFFELISLHKKPLIISTGLSSEQEVIDAVRAVDGFYQDFKMGDQRHALLQCTSMYPIEYSDANLNVMHKYKKLFPNYKVGYSDHTIGTTAIQVAISMGAKVIEAHFTDKKIKSDFRDHKVSKTVDEFKDIIKFSQQVKQLQGSQKKSLLEIEKAHGHEVSFRRSLYLNKKLTAGAIILENDIVVLRPAVGIPASEFKNLIGKRLVRSKEALEVIDWDDFEDI
jgi:N,N'-diacetyllegionaminate synthase